MAGAIQRMMGHVLSPRAGEDRMSDRGSNKVVRLPRAAERRKTLVADQDASRQRLTAILTQLITRDVVPKLLSNRDQATDKPLPLPPASIIVPADAPTQDAVVAFTETLLYGAAGVAAASVTTLLDSGIQAETLSLHLLSAAARHLGELWEADRVSFAEVTLATGQLQDIFRDLAPLIAPASTTRGAALLVATPGEQHSFGLTMLATFFRQAGWTAQTPRARNAIDIQRRVASTPFDVLGFSLGAEIHLTELARCIEVARRSSCRQSLAIMVGGPVFIARPELATSVGADATASDATDALAQAERLLRAGQP